MKINYLYLALLINLYSCSANIFTHVYHHHVRPIFYSITGKSYTIDSKTHPEIQPVAEIFNVDLIPKNAIYTVTLPAEGRIHLINFLKYRFQYPSDIIQARSGGTSISFPCNITYTTTPTSAPRLQFIGSNFCRLNFIQTKCEGENVIYKEYSSSYNFSKMPQKTTYRIDCSSITGKAKNNFLELTIPAFVPPSAVDFKDGFINGLFSFNAINKARTLIVNLTYNDSFYFQMPADVHHYAQDRGDDDRHDTFSYSLLPDDQPRLCTINSTSQGSVFKLTVVENVSEITVRELKCQESRNSWGVNYENNHQGSIRLIIHPQPYTSDIPSTSLHYTSLIDRNTHPFIEKELNTINLVRMPYNAIYHTSFQSKKNITLQLPITSTVTSIPYTKDNPQDADLNLHYDSITHSFNVQAPYVTRPTIYKLDCSFLYPQGSEKTYIYLTVTPLSTVSAKESPSVETDLHTYNVDSIPAASIYATTVHYEDAITLVTPNSSIGKPVYIKSLPSLPDLQFTIREHEITFTVPEPILPATYVIDGDSLGVHKDNMISFTITNEINLFTIKNPENPIYGKNILPLNSNQTFTIKARRGDSLSFSCPLDATEQPTVVDYEKYKASVIGSAAQVKEVMKEESNRKIFTITIPSNITTPATYSVNFVTETWKRSNLKNKMLSLLKSNTIKVADIIIE